MQPKPRSRKDTTDGTGEQQRTGTLLDVTPRSQDYTRKVREEPETYSSTDALGPGIVSVATHIPIDHHPAEQRQNGSVAGSTHHLSVKRRKGPKEGNQTKPPRKPAKATQATQQRPHQNQHPESTRATKETGSTPTRESKKKGEQATTRTTMSDRKSRKKIKAEKNNGRPPPHEDPRKGDLGNNQPNKASKQNDKHHNSTTEDKPA